MDPVRHSTIGNLDDSGITRGLSVGKARRMKLDYNISLHALCNVAASGARKNAVSSQQFRTFERGVETENRTTIKEKRAVIREWRMISLTIVLQKVACTKRAFVGKIYSVRQTDAHGLGRREGSVNVHHGPFPIGPKLVMYTISLGDCIHYRGKGSLPNGSTIFMTLNTDCCRTYTW